MLTCVGAQRVWGRRIRKHKQLRDKKQNGNPVTTHLCKDTEEEQQQSLLPLHLLQHWLMRIKDVKKILQKVLIAYCNTEQPEKLNGFFKVSAYLHLSFSFSLSLSLAQNSSIVGLSHVETFIDNLRYLVE